jgi:tetratricopeptide (TPR) repeat protein
MDVAPTLVTLAGISLPAMMDGRPLFAGGSHRETRVPYAESLYGYETARWAQVFAIRTGDRKLVDAGPRTLIADLAAGGDDDATTMPAVFLDGETPSDPEAHAVVNDQLRRIAGLPPLVPPAEGDSSLAGGSYWSATSEREGILPREENATLPSPYDRMEVARALDEARAKLAAGDVSGAEAGFRMVIETDPGNPQAHRWLARALQAQRRFADAAASYRAAFDAGWRDSDCLAKALQSSALAETRDEAVLGLNFLKLARGKGIRQNGPAFVFEALLLHAAGRPIEALRALENARSEPETPQLTRLIDGADGVIR